MIETLAQITGRTRRGRPFCAAIVLFDDRVVEAAPILMKPLKGKTRAQVRTYCFNAGWRVSVVWQIERRDIDAQGRAVEELR